MDLPRDSGTTRFIHLHSCRRANAYGRSMQKWPGPLPVNCSLACKPERKAQRSVRRIAMIAFPVARRTRITGSRRAFLISRKFRVPGTGEPRGERSLGTLSKGRNARLDVSKSNSTLENRSRNLYFSENASKTVKFERR